MMSSWKKPMGVLAAIALAVTAVAADAALVYNLGGKMVHSCYCQSMAGKMVCNGTCQAMGECCCGCCTTANHR